MWCRCRHRWIRVLGTGRRADCPSRPPLFTGLTALTRLIVRSGHPWRTRSGRRSRRRRRGRRRHGGGLGRPVVGADTGVRLARVLHVHPRQRPRRRCLTGQQGGQAADDTEVRGGRPANRQGGDHHGGAHPVGTAGVRVVRRMLIRVDRRERRGVVAGGVCAAIGRICGTPAGAGGPAQVIAQRAPGRAQLAMNRTPYVHDRWSFRWGSERELLRRGAAGLWQGEEVEPENWLTVQEVAERLDLPVTKVHQMIRDGALLAVRRDGAQRVPAELIANRTVLKHLPGVITLLRDAGYNDEEALRWLYESDDTLPGIPAAALAGGNATEVKRRAQALGF